MSEFFPHYFRVMYEKMKLVSSNDLSEASKLILTSANSGGKLILAGNGGSAAIASHASIDFTKAAKIKAINFNEGSLLTCLSNDFGYENWVAQAIEYYAEASDVICLISSSGASENILNGAKKSKELNIPLITFSGFYIDNQLMKLGDINFWVDSLEYNIVETVHQAWLLSVVDFLVKEKNSGES